MKFSLQFLNNNILKYIYILGLNINFVYGQIVDTCDNRQFYTDFCSKPDSKLSIYLTKQDFEKIPCLYSISTTDKNGNELNLKISSFKFKLLREDSVIYAYKCNKYDLSIVPNLINEVKIFNVQDGDVLYFYDIMVKHFDNMRNKECYHLSLPLIKIIDNINRYPR